VKQRRWPWVVGLGSLGLFAVANLSYPSPDADLLWTGMFTSILVAFVVVGAILTSRVPGNAVGPVLLFSGALLASTIAIGTFSVVGAANGSMPTDVVAITSLINDLGFTLPIVVVLMGIPLIFPDGHLLSARWRWIVVLAIAALVASAIVQVFGPGPLGAAEVPNPFARPEWYPALEVLDALASWSSIIGFGAAILALILRFRRGDVVQRQQLKWPAVSVVIALVFPLAFVLPPGFWADIAFLTGLVALLTLPIFIGIAITRYRLYEIDRIISRTLSWGLVTGILVVVFAGLVIGLQALLSEVTQGGTLAVAGSTLVAFALFQPIRRRVQRAVDRRFDRARYDGERTAAIFAERLRDEVDLESLAAELEHTVVSAIRPTAASLWLPEREPR